MTQMTHYERWLRFIYTKCPFGKIFQKLKNKSNKRPTNQILKTVSHNLFDDSLFDESYNMSHNMGNSPLPIFKMSFCQ